MQTYILTSLLAVSMLTTAAQARKYKPGERYRYRMTTEVTHNGKKLSTIIAVAELMVRDSANIPYDEIHWISKKIVTGTDTIDESNKARQVNPYKISLHPKGKVLLPALNNAGMTGEITDFNTFFVAVSPALNIDQVKIKGTPYPQKESVIGNFANGKDILEGKDCLSTTLQLTNETNTELQYLTQFLPPKEPCLQFLTPDMQTPVAPDTLNNFQMVQPFGEGKFNVFYGKENVIINTTVARKDGKITQATMDNRLSLKMKLSCDGQYMNCQTTIPYTIHRNLKLELITN